MDESILARELKNGILRRLYYLYGEENFLIETYRDKIAKIITQDEYNHIKINGNPDIPALCEAIDALPVFAERKIVTINDFDIEKCNADYTAEFVKMTENIPEHCVIVINITGIAVDNKKAKTKKMLGVFAQNGFVCEFPKMTAAKIADALIEKRVKRKNCRIDRDTALHLADIAKCDITYIANEVDKICCYAAETSGGVITTEMVDMMTTKRLDTGIFTLAAEITARRAAGTFQILNELMECENQPIVIISSLAMTFVDMYRAKIAAMAGAGESQIVSDFNYPKNRAWAVRKSLSAVRNVHLPYLRKCISILSQTDIKLKSSPLKSAATGDSYIMEKAVAELLTA